MFKILAVAFLVVTTVPQLALSKSMAMIIGNDNYENIESLQKARADAAGYSDLFTRMNFDVTTRNDLNGRDMIFELATFFDRIEPGDTVVFVFSGHGWSDGSENFLIPTDIRRSGSETLLARESFALRNGANGIIDEITKRGAGLTLAIVDACRNNPFEVASGTRSIGMARGLAPVQAPSGTFVAFSAGAGQTALDRLSDSDAVPYSVFTRHFLEELSKPQDLQSAFKKTQSLVNEDALRIGHPQRPAYYDEVIGSACLNGRCDGVAIPVAGPALQPKLPILPETFAPKRDLNADAARDWAAFKDSESIEVLKLFVEQYAGTAYAALAQERITKLQQVLPVPVQPLPKQTTPARVAGPRPSWCPNAGTRTERAVCASDLLSKYDIEINSAFQYWRKRLSGNRLARFRSEQKSWLRIRNSCGAEQGCLTQVYQSRLAQIGNFP